MRSQPPDLQRKAHPPRFRGDPEYNRTLRRWVDNVYALNHLSHRPETWGFAIIRTSYDNERLFTRAVDLIDHSVRSFSGIEQRTVVKRMEDILAYWPERIQGMDLSFVSDEEPTTEFLRRYENDIIEDRENLEDASIATVRAYFRAWVSERKREPYCGNIRFFSCIVLDTETLSQLSLVPEAFDGGSGTQAGEPQYWVKMVDLDNELTPDSFRVRLYWSDWTLVDYWF